MKVKRHEFKIGNPCGPCEYHIEKAVKIFAWFDLIFQSLFVIPVILQLKIHLCQLSDTCLDDTSQNLTSQQGDNNVSRESECYDDKKEFAVAYSMMDTVNLSLGMATDMLLFLCCIQKSLFLKHAGAWLYLVLSFFRQLLHVCAIGLHVIRCSPATYPYEIVTRLLCQYLIYGMWIVSEYLGWLNKGREFVPYWRHMEPPEEEFGDEKINSEFKIGKSMGSLSGGSLSDLGLTRMGSLGSIGGGEFDDANAKLRKVRGHKRNPKSRGGHQYPHPRDLKGNRSNVENKSQEEADEDSMEGVYPPSSPFPPAVYHHTNAPPRHSRPPVPPPDSTGPPQTPASGNRLSEAVEDALIDKMTHHRKT